MLCYNVKEKEDVAEEEGVAGVNFKHLCTCARFHYRERGGGGQKACNDQMVVTMQTMCELIGKQLPIVVDAGFYSPSLSSAYGSLVGEISSCRCASIVEGTSIVPGNTTTRGQNEKYGAQGNQEIRKSTV